MGERARPPRVVAIADSDSYLKWGNALLTRMPADWRREQWVTRSPITPSPQQLRAATGRDDLVAEAFLTLSARLLRDPPDVLLLACTGPVVQAFIEVGWPRMRRRPVLVSGLPGISVPATPRAIRFRSGVDLFVIHSERERAAFTALAGESGEDMEVVLARLPFLPAPDANRAPVPAAGRRDVVFAPQATVPARAGERAAILRALAQLPEHLDPVVKVRARAGEQQTHREQLGYQELWADVRGDGDDRLRFVDGSMQDALAGAAGFVTVSSTAALEAIALEVPTLILADFGVSAEMINLVFDGSGLLGTLEDLRHGRFHRAVSAWKAANYFHQDEANDWVARLTELVEQRDRGPLPRRRFAPMGRFRGRLRRWTRVLAPGLAPRARATSAASPAPSPRSR